ncbi:MAG: GTPase HflX [Gemmataceae bacterium]
MGFDKTRSELSVKQELALLVGVSLPDQPWNEADPLGELRGLAETAGATVVGELTQKRQQVQLGTYLGSGKLRELANLAEAKDADVIIFDNELTPSQGKALEQATKCKVLDRSELILDIFATRARTAESRLQVELAQLEYSLPRLKRMWTHLSRVKAGIGMRGPGETQLEEDRRLVNHRIRDLKEKLRIVQGRKAREVASRSTEPTVSLVGYTNAGKSTLMNALTHAGVLSENKLFSTLDTRTRQWKLDDGRLVLLSDTVGFIRNLPHHLVASFQATLEEARQARLLLHVVDASNPLAEEQIRAVEDVLTELDCRDKPTLLVFNKVDRLPDISFLQSLQAKHPRSVAVSAHSGLGLAELNRLVAQRLDQDLFHVHLEAAESNGKLLAWLKSHARDVSEEYRDDKVLITCQVDQEVLAQALRLGATRLHGAEDTLHLEPIDSPHNPDQA